MKILVVEDTPTVRQTLVAFIKRAGHDAVVATCGEDALELISAEVIDLVFMDVEMPGLNGFETTKLIRKALGKYWIPIVFLTSKDDPTSFEQGIESGGDDYLIKPISPIVVRAKIRAFERISTMRDELNRLNRELAVLSRQDGLTQICNRRFFEELASTQWKALKRSQQPVSVLMIDVDHFKSFNDTYGHVAGDQCLKSVATALKRATRRPTDIVARYGGEEFIVLLPQTDLAGTKIVAENMRKAIQDLQIPHHDSKPAPVVTVSIGSASIPNVTGLSMDDMIKHADRCLYLAKREGRNKVVTEEVTPHKTVLVVNDKYDSLSSVTESLRKQCNILKTHSRDECIDIAHNLHPDLILLDMGQPDRKGMNLFQTLKTSHLTTAIPVILITDSKQSSTFADAVLHRPIDHTLLMDKVNQLLD